MRIGILVGSQRKESFSHKIAQEMAAMLPKNMSSHFIEIAQLPMFNQDYDDEDATPASWMAFRQEIGSMHAFLFVTPEYNRSFTPLMKNALDIASRPYGQNMWDGKPAMLVGVSPGSLGAFGACSHLRQVLSFLNLRLMPQPEVYLGNVTECFDQDGRLTPRTLAFLLSAVDSFAYWVR